MLRATDSTPFDWQRVWLLPNAEAGFLRASVALRTTGKSGVRQLSLFEVWVLLAAV